ncbi:hypothetical protein DUI87_25072 [Hirundo rustica rustica]|uniref:Uncharacterized protein n=1 Tax=Hirundo rustica rustica TaxID=333673 RepID=A0A3M0JIL4_HIRRU|nr:hypothetical protein DUI87_25072 [Hirundo rustica rustica]
MRKLWESREVPADLKLVIIVPIFKKVKKEDPGNYRPVSLIQHLNWDKGQKITVFWQDGILGSMTKNVCTKT